MNACKHYLKHSYTICIYTQNDNKIEKEREKKRAKNRIQ